MLVTKMVIFLSQTESTPKHFFRKKSTGYSHLKEEALDRTMWRNRFGRGFGPVVRQNTE
jgi:hypothetical protein